MNYEKITTLNRSRGARAHIEFQLPAPAVAPTNTAPACRFLSPLSSVTQPFRGLPAVRLRRRQFLHLRRDLFEHRSGHICLRSWIEQAKLGALADAQGEAAVSDLVRRLLPSRTAPP